MNYKEEELQKNMEAGKPALGDDLDIRAYEAVFRVLKKDPSYKLSHNFSRDLIRRIQAEQAKDSSRDFIWFGIGLFFLVISFIVAIVISLAFIGFKPSFGFLAEVSAYKGLILVGAALVILFNRLEKKFLHVEPK
jgi:hypothetical protein